MKSNKKSTQKKNINELKKKIEYIADELDKFGMVTTDDVGDSILQAMKISTFKYGVPVGGECEIHPAIKNMLKILDPKHYYPCYDFISKCSDVVEKTGNSYGAFTISYSPFFINPVVMTFCNFDRVTNMYGEYGHYADIFIIFDTPEDKLAFILKYS